jgi:hypothetical protein
MPIVTESYLLTQNTRLIAYVVTLSCGQLGLAACLITMLISKSLRRRNPTLINVLLLDFVMATIYCLLYVFRYWTISSTLMIPWLAKILFRWLPQSTPTARSVLYASNLKAWRRTSVCLLLPYTTDQLHFQLQFHHRHLPIIFRRKYLHNYEYSFLSILTASGIGINASTISVWN